MSSTDVGCCPWTGPSTNPSPCLSRTRPAAVGCAGGIIAVGALGTLAGQIFVAAPVAVGAAIQYFTTITQPFTPPTR
ncbi:hypothetical protein [Nocardia sp. NPDC050793]|uniref:hypothetical protein n=1 Tax=Nocardia sp. NPDC050793 TaxID=3155159 RepID=UPI0034073BB1